MYTAGTISGTKGSTKITGKSTQWLSNLYNILEGQVIIIYTPTSSNAYSIKNIKSNTEIELSKPLYDAFTNATYEIFTTIDNTTSDAAVKIATSIARNNDFMGAMNQWTTGTGTVTVNWGSEQIKLTTVDQMNKNIDAKFDKKGGDITGAVTIKSGGLTITGANDYSGMNLKRSVNGSVRVESNPAGSAYSLNIDNRAEDSSVISTVRIPNKTGIVALTSDLNTKFDKTGGMVTGNFEAQGGFITAKKGNAMIQLRATDASAIALISSINSVNYSAHLMPSQSGTLMQVGDFGVSDPTLLDADSNLSIATRAGQFKQIYSGLATIEKEYPASGRAGTLINYPTADGNTLQEYRAFNASHLIYYRAVKTNGTQKGVSWIYQLNSGNTTKDSNGNIKGASPIVKIYADDIDVNEESEGVELKKLHTGIYQLKGTLGMNSDPSWGGIHGGIVVPNGINGLQLVYADYDVLAVGQPHPFNGEIVPLEENGDIVVYTTYRKHSDLPQNIQRARLKTYPEFTKEVDGEIVELSAGELVDIPNGHWLDVRVQMPSNSVYNIRQAEQEELARIAAEKAEAEEIERLEREAIEEAERIEREEIERLEREEADRLAVEAERESYESNDGQLLV